MPAGMPCTNVPRCPPPKPPLHVPVVCGVPCKKVKRFTDGVDPQIVVLLFAPALGGACSVIVTLAVAAAQGAGLVTV